MASLADENDTTKNGHSTIRDMAECIRVEHIDATAPGYLFSVRLRPDGSYYFPYVSPRLASFLGVSAEELERDGHTSRALVHPDDLGRVLNQFGASARQLTPWQCDLKVCPRGAAVWMEINAQPEREPDGCIIWCGFLTDVTQRRELERQLREAQKLEAIGLLADGVAHDFNNWITVAETNAALLRELIPSGADGSELLDEILDAGARAAALSRQLMAFRRREAAEPRILDLNKLIRETQDMLQRLLGADVSVTTTLSPRIGRVRADEGHCEQVLINLAVNARDAMREGGHFSVETHDLRIIEEAHSSLPPGRYVQLSLTDTGCGMSPAVRARVFEPLFTTKGANGGTGLGLAVVRSIIREAGGYIEVESEPGAGTTFQVFFPVIEDQVDGAPKFDRPTDTRPQAILVVDDDEDVRRIAVRALSRSGYKVLEASSGADALRVFEANEGPLDLLLTDVVMPNIDGRQLADAVRRVSPNTQVLYMSGYADETLVRHGILTGETTLLSKPFTLGSLRLKVQEALALQRHRNHTARTIAQESSLPHRRNEGTLRA